MEPTHFVSPDSLYNTLSQINENQLKHLELADRKDLSVALNKLKENKNNSEARGTIEKILGKVSNKTGKPEKSFKFFKSIAYKLGGVTSKNLQTQIAETTSVYRELSDEQKGHLETINKRQVQATINQDKKELNKNFLETMKSEFEKIQQILNKSPKGQSIDFGKVTVAVAKHQKSLENISKKQESSIPDLRNNSMKDLMRSINDTTDHVNKHTDDPFEQKVAIKQLLEKINTQLSNLS